MPMTPRGRPRSIYNQREGTMRVLPFSFTVRDITIQHDRPPPFGMGGYELQVDAECISVESGQRIPVRFVQEYGPEHPIDRAVFEAMKMAVFHEVAETVRKFDTDKQQVVPFMEPHPENGEDPHR
jgi:hypothetical protein